MSICTTSPRRFTASQETSIHTTVTYLSRARRLLINYSNCKAHNRGNTTEVTTTFAPSQVTGASYETFIVSIALIRD